MNEEHEIEILKVQVSQLERRVHFLEGLVGELENARSNKRSGRFHFLADFLVSFVVIFIILMVIIIVLLMTD